MTPGKKNLATKESSGAEEKSSKPKINPLEIIFNTGQDRTTRDNNSLALFWSKLDKIIEDGRKHGSAIVSDSRIHLIENFNEMKEDYAKKLYAKVAVAITQHDTESFIEEIRQFLIEVITHKDMITSLRDMPGEWPIFFNELHFVRSMIQYLQCNEEEQEEIGSFFTYCDRLPTYFPNMRKKLFKDRLGSYDIRKQENENLKGYIAQLEPILGPHRSSREGKILKLAKENRDTGITKLDATALHPEIVPQKFQRAYILKQKEMLAPHKDKTRDILENLVNNRFLEKWIQGSKNIYKIKKIAEE